MIWKIALGIAIYVFIDAVVLPFFSRKLDKAEAKLGIAGEGMSDKSGR